MGTSCALCAVAERCTPAHVVTEGALSLVALDLYPVADGHCLILPRRHVPTLSDLLPEEDAEMFALATRVAGVIRRTLAPTVNLHVSDGVEAEQDVPHIHRHVITGLMHAWVTVFLRPALRACGP
ncbi:HIT family protein [Micrococcus luteus]|uniref:HIT family protein n=1 Tax=Micrococcus luteus TaxID=1270 RepID=UPI0034C64935